MKLRLHENGWTVLVEDVELQTATQRQMNTIAYLLATNTVVVVRDQSLTIQQQIAICEKIGRLEDFSHTHGTDTVKIARPIESLVVPGSEYKVLRVTGELDEHGRPGLFGHVSDLDWHCNHPANPNREPLVWLYGERGTAGSRTSWINNIMAYNDLSEEDQAYYKTLRLINGYKQGSYSTDDFGKPIDINYSYKPDLVQTNNAGRTGLFFPFLQIHQIDGLSEDESRAVIIKLRDHVLNKKYVYHHDWQDGDIVLAEQWLGIHKRWQFDGMASRVLHRITFDFANCDFGDVEPTDMVDTRTK